MGGARIHKLVLHEETNRYREVAGNLEAELPDIQVVGVGNIDRLVQLHCYLEQVELGFLKKISGIKRLRIPP